MMKMGTPYLHPIQPNRNGRMLMAITHKKMAALTLTAFSRSIRIGSEREPGRDLILRVTIVGS
jgi:hypothetical protein